MVLFGRLARSSGAALLIVWAERLAGGRYRMHIAPLPEAVRSADDRIAACALNAAIETCVRSCPEQYLWAYRRFKSRPAGTPPRYPNKGK
jgi:KDO2-lipid IV(A) lauroyltransferase